MDFCAVAAVGAVDRGFGAAFDLQQNGAKLMLCWLEVR